MKLSEPTRICKICFKEYKANSLRLILMKNNCICNSCYKKFIPKFINFKLDKIEGLALYEYDDNIRTLLYQFKGCYDYELYEVFMKEYILYLKYRYLGYYIVPIPSSKKDDLIREFNHVEEIFKVLNLKMIKVLFKEGEYKQSDHKASERINIVNHLKLSDMDLVKNKRVLLVDDVLTTGNTLKAAVSLLRNASVKKIKILVMAKTKPIH